MDAPTTLYHCDPCNSERPDTTCWKCGAATKVPHPNWDYPRLPPIEQIRQLAREVGYSVGVHGSLQRDMDLIAVPWTEEAVSAQELIDHLCRGLVFNGEPARVASVNEQKPHGRLAVNIQLNGWFKLIDLSITPLQLTSAEDLDPIPEKLTLPMREVLGMRFFRYQPHYDIADRMHWLHIGKVLNRFHVPRFRKDLNEDQRAFLLAHLSRLANLDYSRP